MADWLEAGHCEADRAGAAIRCAIMAWAGVSQLAGPVPASIEFRFRNRTVGHIYAAHDGVALADMVMPPQAAVALIASGCAAPHPVIPAAGWISTSIYGEADRSRVLGLFRQAYDLAGGCLRLI